ncbi:MAG: hypothetical protein COA94_01415 [Rickettsiales bacterium]|nr:MAG: hypothetical protein COA94_01415 [Rickettsiales bacterium]
MKKILIIASSLILLASCSNKAKNSLGITETLPDEYQVTRNKSLEIPPHYHLNAPVNDNKNTGKKKLSEAENKLLKEIK